MELLPSRIYRRRRGRVAAFSNLSIIITTMTSNVITTTTIIRTIKCFTVSLLLFLCLCNKRLANTQLRNGGNRFFMSMKLEELSLLRREFLCGKKERKEERMIVTTGRFRKLRFTNTFWKWFLDCRSFRRACKSYPESRQSAWKNITVFSMISACQHEHVADEWNKMMRNDENKKKETHTHTRGSRKMAMPTRWAANASPLMQLAPVPSGITGFLSAHTCFWFLTINNGMHPHGVQKTKRRSRFRWQWLLPKLAGTSEERGEKQLSTSSQTSCNFRPQYRWRVVWLSGEGGGLNIIFFCCTQCFTVLLFCCVMISDAIYFFFFLTST